MSEEQDPELEIEFPEVTFVAAGDNPEERESNRELVEESPGFPTASILVADAILRRADTVMLDYSAQAVKVRFQIDGLWQTMPPMDRRTGDYMLAAIKQLAGMNYKERRQRQKGQFEALFEGKKIKPKIVSQGVATGERVAIFTNRKKPPSETVEELGMRPRMREALAEQLRAETGIIISCGMPKEGLTTSWRATLNAFDRFMRDYYVIEEKRRQEPEVINISQITFDEKAGEDYWTKIPQLMLLEPNVLVFSEVPSGEMLNKIMDLAEKENLLLVLRIPAKHALDALLRMIALKPNVEQLLRMTKAVLGMRSIRMLCEKCKLPYPPNPNLLAKLGIPPGRIQYLYQPFKWNPQMRTEEDEPVDPCPDCMGVGYKELKGLFELLVLNDPIREAVKASPRLDTLTQTAKQSNHVTIQDEGIVLVAKGDTSIEELQRVLNKDK